MKVVIKIMRVGDEASKAKENCQKVSQGYTEAQL
jgi:hypothetical protein